MMAVWRRDVFSTEARAEPWIWNTIYIASHGTAYGYQLYDYRLHALKVAVSPTWNFGQVMAVTVWNPYLVEVFS
jgi:hypothetical protein